MKRREFLSVGTAAAVTVSASPLWAGCGKVLRSCDPNLAPNRPYHGDLDLKLDTWASVCHPDYDKLNEKWYSLGIVAPGGLMKFIERIQKGQRVVELIIENAACVAEQYVPHGGRLLVVTPCRIEGKYVILVTEPIIKSGHYDLIDFPELRQYAFPITHQS